MTSTRTTARVAGVFYLITFVASIPAVALLAPVLNNPDSSSAPAATLG